MATRNINSFIQHLINEAMTTSGGGGGDNPTPGDPASYDNPDDAPSGIPFSKPKPTSFDQSDEDGNIIPGRKPRVVPRRPVDLTPFRNPNNPLEGPRYIPPRPRRVNEKVSTAGAKGGESSTTRGMGGGYRSGPPQDDRHPDFEGPPERPYGGDEPGDKVVFPQAPVDHRPFDADDMPPIELLDIIFPWRLKDKFPGSIRPRKTS